MEGSERAYLEAEYGDVGEGPWLPVRRRPARRPWVALALTLLVPGLGHLYGGDLRRGLRLWSGLLALLLVPAWFGALDHFWGLVVVLSLAGGLYLYTMWDAASRARSMQTFEPGPYNRWWVYGAVVLFSTTVVAPGVKLLVPIQTFATQSGSMEPTIRPGDRFCARKGSFAADDIERGDVVLFESIEDPALLQTFRIVGLPREEIRIVDKTVYIDGEPLGEDAYAQFGDGTTYPASPFVPEEIRARDQFGPLIVPAGHVFVMGDNRDFAYDSRFFGPVPVSNVRGRPLYVYLNRHTTGFTASWDVSRVGRRID